MKSKILGLLAVGLLTGPIATPAVAVPVTIGGVDYNVTTQPCVYATDPACVALVQSQPWWGSSATAISAAQAVGALLGYPNGGWGPNFAYAYDDPSCFGTGSGLVCTVILFIGTPTVTFGNWVPTINWHYAVAQRVAPVPEPGTLALLGLGLAGLSLSRRRKLN